MPTGYTPIYQIRKDGLDITGHFSDRCTQLRVDFDSGNDTCLFTIDDRDWAVARPNVGDTIQIYLGYVEVGLCNMGSYEIDEVTFQFIPKSILIKGTSTGQRSLYKSQLTQNFDGKTVGEIMTKMASQGGLLASIHPEVAGIDVLFKNMTTSPQQVITELKRHYGLAAKAVDGKLQVTPIDAGENASGEKLPIVALTEEHFGSGSVKHTERGRYTQVKAAYVDENHVTQFADATPATGGASGLGNIPYVIERKFSDLQSAQRAAKAQAQAMTRSLGEGSFELAKGDPWIRDMQRIMIYGTRDGIDGSYVAELVSHTYVKDQGILTTIKTRPDSNGGNYQSIYDEATPAQRKSLFLIPGPGGVVGSVIGNALQGAVDPIIQGALNLIDPLSTATR